MPAYKNVNGTWTIVKHVWVNVNGTWTKVRRLMRNVGGVWTQYHGDNDFVAYSLGLLQNQVTGSKQGLWKNATQTFTAFRSYNLNFFDKYGNVTFSRGYDLFGESSGGAPTSTAFGSAQLAADIAGMATGQLFLLTTFDEPQAGIMKAPILSAAVNAILSIGATAGVFQNANFAYRSAYMLLGQKGSAATFEANRGTLSTGIGTGGTDQGCLDGAIQISFNIVNGAYANLTRQL
jgi:hypothetical protein